MPSRVKTTRCYFLLIVILSSLVVFMSFKWKVTENVYKISSEISQVKISGVFYSNVKFKDSTEDTNSAGNVSDIINSAGNVSDIINSAGNVSDTINSAGNVADIILSKAFNNEISRQELQNMYDSRKNDIGLSSRYITVTPELLADNLLAENKLYEAPSRNLNRKSELPSEQYRYYAAYKKQTFNNSNKTDVKRPNTREDFVTSKMVTEKDTTVYKLANKLSDENIKPKFQILHYSRNLRENLKTINNFKTSNKLVSLENNDKELETDNEKLKNIEDRVTKFPSIKQHRNSTFNDEKLNEIRRRIERFKTQLVNKQGRIVKGLTERVTDVGNEGQDIDSDKMEFKRLRNSPTKKILVNEKVLTINEVQHIPGNVVISDSTVVGIRPDNCKQCFKSNFQKIINEPDLCQGDVDILILIASSFSNIDSRNAIRSTWCKICNDAMSKIRYLFVFGNRNIMIENLQLLEESKTYQDIIQIDFYDSYANLTYKTISALQWSIDHCQKAKFVMKTDDDMYVNTELLQHLLKVAPKNKLFGGKCWGPSTPFRDSNSKWYVSLKQYQHSYFPSMCSGTGYVMSNDVVTGILRQSPNVPFFHLEDVYVAICVQRLGIRPKLINGFKNNLVDYDACIYRNKLFTSHGFTAVLLEYVWPNIQTCPIEPVRPLELYSAVTV